MGIFVIQNVNCFLITVPFIKNLVLLTIHKKFKNFWHFFVQFKKFIELFCLSNQTWTHYLIFAGIILKRKTRILKTFFELFKNNVNIFNDVFSIKWEINHKKLLKNFIKPDRTSSKLNDSLDSIFFLFVKVFKEITCNVSSIRMANKN